MLFHMYGEPTKPTIILLPDSCCHWEYLFDEAANLLAHDFYVAVCAYDGFDPDRPDIIFKDLPTEIACIENFVRTNLEGRVQAIYGCGFGGKVALVIAQRSARYDHVIIDGCDFAVEGKMIAGTNAKAIARGFTKLFKGENLTDDMQKILDGADEIGRAYLEKLYAIYGVGSGDMSFVQKKSINNLLLTALTYNVGRNVEVPEGTKVHIMCPMISGGEFLEDAQRFADPDIRQYQAAKLELLLCHPQTWVEEIKACCQMRDHVEHRTT